MSESDDRTLRGGGGVLRVQRDGAVSALGLLLDRLLPWAVVAVLFFASVLVVVFLLRNELRACFGGCGRNGCGVCGSVSNAPGP
jgi:hypothetical protein